MALREVKIDVVQGRVAAVEPYSVFLPLFRQIDILRETDFGVFVPLWTPELVEEGQFMPLLPTVESAGTHPNCTTSLFGPASTSRWRGTITARRSQLALPTRLRASARRFHHRQHC